MGQLIQNGRLAWRLMRDARVPAWVRLGIPVVLLIYLVSPVDIIPDFILGLGQIDDLGVILFGLGMMVRFSPQHVVEEHKRALGYIDNTASGAGSSSGDYWSTPPGGKSQERGGSGPIEGEYRVVPPDSAHYSDQ